MIFVTPFDRGIFESGFWAIRVAIRVGSAEDPETHFQWVPLPATDLR